MDQSDYAPHTNHKRKVSKRQIKEMKKNMRRIDDIKTLEQQYQKKEKDNLQSLDELLKTQ